jgi:hypothetical protein
VASVPIRSSSVTYPVDAPKSSATPWGTKIGIKKILHLDPMKKIGEFMIYRDSSRDFWGSVRRTFPTRSEGTLEKAYHKVFDWAI